MLFNDVLRSLRYTLDLPEAKVVDIIALSNTTNIPNVTTIAQYLKAEEDSEFKLCPETVLLDFLDGLVVSRRGPSPMAAYAPSKLTNNMILKKLRIAFELKENDLFQLFDAVGFNVTKSELSALFRSEGHKNYHECGDQFLRNFLKGLSIIVRGAE